MSRALRNGRGKAAAANAYHAEAQTIVQERAGRAEQLADFRAFLFRLEPAHTNLTAWADAYGAIPEDGAR